MRFWISLQRDFRMAQEKLLEVGAREDRELRRLERHHRGRARLLVEHHLAEILSRALDREDQLLAVLVGEIDLHAAGEDEIERVALVALVDDDRLLRVAARDGAIRQRAQIGLRDLFEEGNALEIDRHGGCPARLFTGCDA
jgi:hypothetical protein